MADKLRKAKKIMHFLIYIYWQPNLETTTNQSIELYIFSYELYINQLFNQPITIFEEKVIWLMLPNKNFNQRLNCLDSHSRLPLWSRVFSQQTVKTVRNKQDVSSNLLEKSTERPQIAIQSKNLGQSIFKVPDFSQDFSKPVNSGKKFLELPKGKCVSQNNENSIGSINMKKKIKKISKQENLCSKQQLFPKRAFIKEWVSLSRKVFRNTVSDKIQNLNMSQSQIEKNGPFQEVQILSRESTHDNQGFNMPPDQQSSICVQKYPVLDETKVFSQFSEEYRSKIVSQRIDNDIESDDEYIEKSIVKMTKFLKDGFEAHLLEEQKAASNDATTQ